LCLQLNTAVKIYVLSAARSLGKQQSLLNATLFLYRMEKRHAHWLMAWSLTGVNYYLSVQKGLACKTVVKRFALGVWIVPCGSIAFSEATIRRPLQCVLNFWRSRKTGWTCSGAMVCWNTDGRCAVWSYLQETTRLITRLGIVQYLALCIVHCP